MLNSIMATTLRGHFMACEATRAAAATKPRAKGSRRRPGATDHTPNAALHSAAQGRSRLLTAAVNNLQHFNVSSHQAFKNARVTRATRATLLVLHRGFLCLCVRQRPDLPPSRVAGFVMASLVVPAGSTATNDSGATSLFTSGATPQLTVAEVKAQLAQLGYPPDSVPDSLVESFLKDSGLFSGDAPSETSQVTAPSASVPVPKPADRPATPPREPLQRSAKDNVGSHGFMWGGTAPWDVAPQPQPVAAPAAPMPAPSRSQTVASSARPPSVPARRAQRRPATAGGSVRSATKHTASPKARAAAPRPVTAGSRPAATRKPRRTVKGAKGSKRGTRVKGGAKKATKPRSSRPQAADEVTAVDLLPAADGDAALAGLDVVYADDVAAQDAGAGAGGNADDVGGDHVGDAGDPILPVYRPLSSPRQDPGAARAARRVAHSRAGPTDAVPGDERHDARGASHDTARHPATPPREREARAGTGSSRDVGEQEQGSPDDDGLHFAARGAERSRRLRQRHTPPGSSIHARSTISPRSYMAAGCACRVARACVSLAALTQRCALWFDADIHARSNLSGPRTKTDPVSKYQAMQRKWDEVSACVCSCGFVAVCAACSPPTAAGQAPRQSPPLQACCVHQPSCCPVRLARGTHGVQGTRGLIGCCLGRRVTASGALAQPRLRLHTSLRPTNAVIACACKSG